jgi:hypothetical protein
MLQANRKVTAAAAAAVCRQKLRAYQEKLAAGGYEPLRLLGTREEVQQLHAKSDAMTGMMQRQRDDELQGLQDQLQQRQPPRSLENEEFEQERALAGVNECRHSLAQHQATAATQGPAATWTQANV